MKKHFRILTAAVLAASLLAGCGAGAGNSAGSTQRSSESADATNRKSDADTSDTAAGASTGDSGAAGSGTSTAAASGTADALIIYFDYSENMSDTSSMDTDAITSASLAGESYKGIKENDLLVMRDEIQKKTGADVYSVQVTDPYDPDYNKMVSVAQDDQNDDKEFHFKEALPDLSGYQTIYMGMPVWWGGLPQPMVSFLDQNDFSGKTIIPFGIHLGSRFGRMVDQIEEMEPNATVSEDGLTINSHTANDEVVSAVDEWLEKLGK